jgi:hypothetical protein
MESPFSDGDYGHYTQLDDKNRVRFDKAVMSQAEDDNIVYEMITSWTPERVDMYQTAFYLYNLANQMRQIALDEGASLMEYIMENHMNEDEDEQTSDDESDDPKPFQLGI